MYYYRFQLTPSHPNSDIDYTKYQQVIISAINSVNNGIAFKRDGKNIEITNSDISSQKIHLTLKCKTPLSHAARSLSALTRYLTGNYPDIFAKYIFNKTLFHMEMISQYSSFDDMNELSDTDLLKGIIDLLFTHTTTTKTESDLREKTISNIKELIKPYIKR